MRVGDHILWSQIGSGFQNHAALYHSKFPEVQPLLDPPGPARPSPVPPERIVIKGTC